LWPESSKLKIQHLLLPEILELSPAALGWIGAAGLSAESFGSGSLKVDAIPVDAYL
jgi:hypothetical protein